MEFLSLLLHDGMLKNYAKQGIFPNDVTVSYHQLFFIQITKLSIYDITKLNDIKEIIWFINSTGMQYLVQTREIYDKMMFVHQRACSVKNWVHSRHKSFYVWMMFGWRQLPKEYPSHDSAGPLNQ